MAFKGTASKSASGASMSKYDVEVEGRLKALESKVGEINNIEGMINDLVRQVSELQAQVSQLQFQEAQEGGGGDCSAVEAKLDRLINLLNSNNFFEGTSCPKDPDGVKRFH